MMAPERHDLVYLSSQGRERVFAELAAKGFEERVLREMLLPETVSGMENLGGPVPGIVRREEFDPRPGMLPVGFVYWRSSEAGRFRVGSFAAPEEVVSVVAPEEVLRKMSGTMDRTPALAALSALRGVLEGLPLRVGVWGSAALEIETGLFYTHQFSDLDIRVAPVGPVDRDVLEQCLARVTGAEKEFSVRVDCELRTGDGYGISIKELLNQGVTVLAKGGEDVVLLQKEDVFSGLSA